jgi:predicted transcriptional regulator
MDAAALSPDPPIKSIPAAPTGETPGAGASVVLQSRAAARVAVEYFLRQVETVSMIVEGDFFLGLVLAAMGSANVARVARSPELSERYGSQNAIPDELKTPISVYAIATSLGLPYETGRRYVRRLEKLGMCEKTKGGWVVPAKVLMTSQAGTMIERSIANLRQFIVALRAAGVDIDAIR